MSDLGLARRQVVAEQRSFWRNPAAAGFTIIFPLMLLVVFASLNSGTRIHDLGNIRFIEYYVPGILAYAVIAACFMSLAMNLTRQRDEGILKRKRATPLPAWALIAGLVGSAIIIAFVLSVATIGVGHGRSTATTRRAIRCGWCWSSCWAPSPSPRWGWPSPR